MKIIKINVMRGPNYWSNYRKKVIVLRVDLENYAEIYTDQIAGFSDALKNLIPSLYEHRCSEGIAGGFLQRLKDGTLLGHVLEHIALELQTLAGMNCGYGRARDTNEKGIFHVVFAYEVETAGLKAADMAMKIIKTLIAQQEYNELAKNIEELKAIYLSHCLGPSTEAILKEAMERDIPCTPIHKSMIMLGYGENQKRISATIGHHTSCIGVDIASDKKLTKELLDSEFIPVPKGSVITSLDELHAEIEVLGFPLVIKPQFGNHGKGITTNIINTEKACIAFANAKKIAESVIVEKFISGFDYRFLLINFKLVAVAKRTPPSIVGDGIKTVHQLIEDINNDPNRGKSHENLLTKVHIDEMTHIILESNNLNIDSILPLNQRIYLKDTANISTGGTATDMTDSVHPYNIYLAERIARLTNLDVCGIDLIAKDITLPLKKSNGAILEINAAPGFRMHLAPTFGQKRNVAKAFIDMLYPDSKNARIPIIAVTGTNGKTTVVRLVAHLAQQAKYSVGMAMTEGIYLNKREIYRGDCSGPKSASIILRDPTVNFAVLECARGGMLRSGLAFDKCNISVLTNISEDHLGIDSIHTIEELSRLKAVVPHSTAEDGYAVLNADDDLVYQLKDELKCHIALFSAKKNARISTHVTEGKLCCYVENDTIVLAENGRLVEIISIKNIPLSLNGKSKCMVQNILSAVLVGWISKFTLQDILEGLRSFLPNSENLPGRMNLFKFNNCMVMLDYAHNENAYKELKEYLQSIKVKKKIGIIAGTGDRRESDILKTGSYAAEMFDEIIIRHDEDSRGRTHEEITNIIINGIQSVDPNKPFRVISDEFDAIEYAIYTSKEDTFIWYFPDKVLNAVHFLKTRKEFIKQE